MCCISERATTLLQFISRNPLHYLKVTEDIRTIVAKIVQTFHEETEGTETSKQLTLILAYDRTDIKTPEEHEIQSNLNVANH